MKEYKNNPLTQCNSVQYGSLTANTAFATGSGIEIKFLNEGTIQVRVAPDQAAGSIKDPKGYDYYFHIALTNNGADTKEVILEALRPGTISENKEWFLSQAPIICSTDGEMWYLLPNVQATDGHRDYRCPVTILPDETIQVANNTPIIPEYVTTRLQSIAQANPEQTRYHEIGYSVQGSPISLLEIDDCPQIERDRFLIWAGIHPSEPDPLVAFWAIEWLMSDDPKAKRAREAYAFEILPMINPDGFNLGTSGSNSRGINIFWDFRRDDPKNSPESTALWRWIQARPPQVAIDFHAYIYQVHKKARPYIRPICSYPPKLRRAAWSMQRAVINKCGGEFLFYDNNALNFTLAPYLTDIYGTLTLPGYHLHWADGPEVCRQLTIDTLVVVMEATLRYQPLRAIVSTSRQTRIDISGVVCRLCSELLHSKLLQRISRIWKRFVPNPNARPAIDTMIEWTNHRFDSPKRTPVATIRPEQIS